MEMHQVRYFRALCDELNFTRAAARCNVSQPSLTRAIGDLEKEFGGRLFNRERSNTHLTELGRIVKPYLDQIHEQASRAVTHAREFLNLGRSQLKLGIMCTIARDQLIEMVSTMRASHPNVQLEIVDDGAGELDKQLLMGELEVAIYCRPGENRDERLHFLPLFREQMMIVVNRQHRLAAAEAITLPDLDGEDYLERINCEFGEVAGEAFEKREIDGDTVYRSDRDDWVMAMAAAGLGYAFMPHHLVSHPQVLAIPLIEPEFWREVSLVTVRGRPHSPGVGALIQIAMKIRWLGQPARAAQQFTADERDAP